MQEDIVKTSIGDINLGFDIQSLLIKKRVSQHYKKFITTNIPNVLIRVKNKPLRIPLEKKLIFTGRSWKIYKNRNCKFICFFAEKRITSMAKLDLKSNLINFYTQNNAGQLLLYLFPGIVFNLILPLFNRLMFHACGVLDGNNAYLFIASSGGGKSTIAKLALKERFTVLNDDRIIVHKQKSKFKMHATPWHGEVGEVSNESSYIDKIFFLKKAKINRIKPINKIKAISEFYKNSFYLPIDSDIMKNVFDIMADIVSNLDCYWFNFKSDKNIWGYLDGYFK